MNAHHGEAHDASLSSRLNTLRAGILGANDGIVSISALLLGVMSSGVGSTAVIISGLASTVAGAVSMALGEYVSVSAQRDNEKMLIAKERDELSEMPREEMEELSGILQGYGISKSTADLAATEISAGDPLDAHLQLELGLNADDLTSPWAAAGSSAASFLLGALLPMLAVFFAADSWAPLIVVVVTLASLAVTGGVSAVLAGNPIHRSIIRLVLGGALGLAVTYGLGSLFDVVA